MEPGKVGDGEVERLRGTGFSTQVVCYNLVRAGGLREVMKQVRSAGGTARNFSEEVIKVPSSFPKSVSEISTCFR